MTTPTPPLQNRTPHVVGSFAGRQDLRTTSLEVAQSLCDIVEVRLDLLAEEPDSGQEKPWQHLGNMPLLFTARRLEEGGALPLSAEERMAMLRRVLDEAALVDVEIASIGEMGGLLDELRERQLTWVASCHDFSKLPNHEFLLEALGQAKAAGADVFKLAAYLDGPAALARLAEFQREDHGLPVATMGMGPLAPVSRLLCAQAGSVLNYGYVGAVPTAPGQWDAEFLKRAIARLAEWPAGS